ncbi:MAG: carbamate kinase [Candidatus Krumholzibacteria bacterium]|nr:carbamate kinase [Candidatus Krumholzibacteria bacterium]
MGTIDEQRELTSISMEQVANLIFSGRSVLLTHGNGPIVGNITERNEAVKDQISPMPLDVCGADSQGGIGYMIQQALRNELSTRSISKQVVSLVSQVLVSEKDEAFNNPTKPIGRFYEREKALEMEREKGWKMKDDAGRGYRRVVPSPRPLEIVEADVISKLLEIGIVVIAVGGGGIPVVMKDGKIHGIEAVIDKDRAAAVLAKNVGAERLIILTNVAEVYVDFGKPNQRALEKISLSDIIELHKSGEFPPGSMGPKIEAAIDFIQSGGEEVIISHAMELLEACDGNAGTHIVPG